MNFVTFREDIDHAPLLKGLPDDQCQCPHWGYVIKGKMTFRFGDREEVFQAGDAFYAHPVTFRSQRAGHRDRAVQPGRGAARDHRGHHEEHAGMQAG